MARLKTFPVPSERHLRARNISFGEDDSVVVSGSDHGLVYVFRRRDGMLLEQLGLPADGWCQTVIVSDSDVLSKGANAYCKARQSTTIRGRSLILAAKSSTVDGVNPIYVWEKRERRDPQIEERSATFSLTWNRVYQILGLLWFAALVYYQANQSRFRTNWMFM